jgi:hypothetical protein
MTEDKVIELATEETRKTFPNLETSNPSYFSGVVQLVTNTIVNDYALNTLGSEEKVKELMALDLENLKKALN